MLTIMFIKPDLTENGKKTDTRKTIVTKIPLYYEAKNG